MASRVALAAKSLNKITFGHVLDTFQRRVAVCSNAHKFFQHGSGFCVFSESSSDSESDLVIPKRPSTSFNRFYMEKYYKIRENNPDVKAVTGISKIAGEMWKNLGKDEKKVYEEAYQKDRKEYDALLTPKIKEKIKEKALEKKVEKTKKNIKKASKSSGRPKIPPSGYALFVKEKSSGTTSSLKAQQELMKDLAELWKAMGDADKKPYRDRAEVERSQYQKDLKVWEKKMFKDGRLELVRKATINELTLPKKTTPKKTTPKKTT